MKWQVARKLVAAAVHDQRPCAGQRGPRPTRESSCLFLARPLPGRETSRRTRPCPARRPGPSSRRRVRRGSLQRALGPKVLPGRHRPDRAARPCEAPLSRGTGRLPDPRSGGHGRAHRRATRRRGGRPPRPRASGDARRLRRKGRGREPPRPPPPRHPVLQRPRLPPPRPCAHVPRVVRWRRAPHRTTRRPLPVKEARATSANAALAAAREAPGRPARRRSAACCERTSNSEMSSQSARSDQPDSVRSRRSDPNTALNLLIRTPTCSAGRAGRTCGHSPSTSLSSGTDAPRPSANSLRSARALRDPSRVETIPSTSRPPRSRMRSSFGPVTSPRLYPHRRLKGAPLWSGSTGRVRLLRARSFCGPTECM